MKYFLFFLITASTLWELTFTYDSWWQFALLSLMSTAWVVGSIYIYDFAQAVTGGNSPYYQEFYGELKKDFFIALASGLALVFVLYLSSAAYSLSSIDIAFAGFPFLLMSIVDTVTLQKSTIYGARLPKSTIRFQMTLQLFTIDAFIYYLVKINSNAYPPLESLWIQITLLLTAFCLCIFSHQMVFILKKQRMEVSPVIVGIFDSIKMSRGVYKQAGIMATRWNEIVFQKKNEQRTLDKRKAKKSRKKH
jgi:hypothetical protein